MNILYTNTDIGLIWYTSKDWKQRTVHVVCYGLEVKQFGFAKDAKRYLVECQTHHYNAEGITDEDTIKALCNR